ncbi:cytochrome p450 2u1 [Plakobranchus ocellatus]|uniref:Cytochrome p450 2u1 n=1 Tax=Plakobranchus ocellatus TaxID=259542 RepID=A0AAV3Z600_9GAST|nr:cytochrome p450 2u1 [Plakobranchus ocellatus]
MFRDFFRLKLILLQFIRASYRTSIMRISFSLSRIVVSTMKVFRVIIDLHRQGIGHRASIPALRKQRLQKCQQIRIKYLNTVLGKVYHELSEEVGVESPRPARQNKAQLLLGYRHGDTKIRQHCATEPSQSALLLLASIIRRPCTKGLVSPTHVILHAKASRVPHLCIADVTIQGYTIPAEAVVLPNLDAAMWDENTWEEPLKFRPKRFLDDTGALIKTRFLHTVFCRSVDVLVKLTKA